MGNNSQRSKLTLRAMENILTQDVKNDYYLTVKRQKTLSLQDLAREVAATHGHQNASEVEMLAREVMELAAWYLSNGFSVNLPLGYFQTNVQGNLTEAELTEVKADRIRLSVGYTMSQEVTDLLAQAEIDVEADKAKVGPQITAVVSSQDVQHPEAVTRGESVPVRAGAVTIIRGKNLKVGGPEGSQAGITLTRTDQSGTTLFIPAADIYPNEPKQLGFIMPATAPDGSTWSVTVTSQLNSRGEYLKSPRSFTLEQAFTVGQASAVTPPSSGGTGGSDDGEGTLG